MIYTCPYCKRDIQTDVLPIHCTCGNIIEEEKPSPPSIGPGTTLKNLLAWLYPPCEPCSVYAEQMNLWGKEGCRDKFGEITGHLLNQAIKKTWYVKPNLLAVFPAAVSAAILWYAIKFSPQVEQVPSTGVRHQPEPQDRSSRRDIEDVSFGSTEVAEIPSN